MRGCFGCKHAGYLTDAPHIILAGGSILESPIGTGINKA